MFICGALVILVKPRSLSLHLVAAMIDTLLHFTVESHVQGLIFQVDLFLLGALLWQLLVYMSCYHFGYPLGMTHSMFERLASYYVEKQQQQKEDETKNDTGVEQKRTKGD